MPITPEELTSYFAFRNNRFTNEKGMSFERHEKKGIFTNSDFPDINAETIIDEDSIALTIYTSWDSDEEFIILFRLENLADIENLSYINSWMRYLNSYAEITAQIIDLEIDLHFRILEEKTIIFSPDLHFYDEEFKHLTLRGDFENYIKNNTWKLEEAATHQYRYYRRRRRK